MVQFGVIKEQGVAITSNPIFFTFSTFPNGSQPKPLLSHPKRNSVRRMTVQTHSMELYAIFPCEPLGARIKTDCRLDPYFPFSRMTGKPTHKKIKIQNDSLGRLNLGHQHLLQTFCLSFSPSPPFPPNSPLLSLSFDKGMLGESFDSQLVDQRWGGRGEREKKKFLPGKKRKMLLSPQSTFRRKDLRSPHREESDVPRDCYSPTNEQSVHTTSSSSPPSSPSRPLLRSSSPSPLVSSLRPPLVVGLKGRQMAPPPVTRAERYSFSRSSDSHFGFGGSQDEAPLPRPRQKVIRKNSLRKPKAKAPQKKDHLKTSSSDSSDEGVKGHKKRLERRKSRAELPSLAHSKESRFLGETTDSPREKRTSCTSGDSEDSIVRIIRYRSEKREVRCPTSPKLRPSETSDTSSSTEESNSDVEITSRRAAINFMLDCIDNDNDNDDDVGGSDIMDDGSRLLLTTSDDMTSSDLTSADEYESDSDRQQIGESNYADAEEDFKGDDTSSADVYSALPGRFLGWERVVGLDLSDSVGKYTREMFGLSKRNFSDSEEKRCSSPVSSLSIGKDEPIGLSSDSEESDTDSDFDFVDLRKSSPAIVVSNLGETKQKKRLMRRKPPRKRDASRRPARKSFQTPKSEKARSPVLVSFAGSLAPRSSTTSRTEEKKFARWGNSSGSETARSSEWHVASSLSEVSEDDLRSDGSTISHKKKEVKSQMNWKSALNGVFFLQQLTSLFVTHCVMNQNQDLVLLPSDFLKEWLQGVFLHLLTLPILHPIFCIFLFTLSDLIPYHNFFQAITLAHSMGLFQCLFPTLILHVLRDISHVTAITILHQLSTLIPKKKKKGEMGQQLGRGQNFRFLVKFGRVLIYWFGKVFSAFITLVLSTFLTVSFVVVTTRQVVHNTTAVEPIGPFGALELLSKEPDGLLGVTMKSGSFLMGVMVFREIALFLSPKSKLLIYSLFALALPFSFTVLVRVSLGGLYIGTACHSGADCTELLIREGLMNLAPKYWAFCWLAVPSILAGVVI